MDDTIFDEETEEELLCYVEQDEEREVDRLAQEFNEALQSDISAGFAESELEHGALIVTFEGRTFILPRVTGNENSIPFRVLTEGGTGLAANSLSFEHVVGIIHRHPPSDLSTLSARIGDDAFNRGPSTGDLATAETISQLGGGQNVATYIISPDGDLLEYEGYVQPSWARESYSDDEIKELIEAATEANLLDAMGDCIL